MIWYQDITYNIKLYHQTSKEDSDLAMFSVFVPSQRSWPPCKHKENKMSINGEWRVVPSVPQGIRSSGSVSTWNVSFLSSSFDHFWSKDESETLMCVSQIRLLNKGDEKARAKKWSWRLQSGGDLSASMWIELPSGSRASRAFISGPRDIHFLKPIFQIFTFSDFAAEC